MIYFKAPKQLINFLRFCHLVIKYWFVNVYKQKKKKREKILVTVLDCILMIILKFVIFFEK